MKRVFILLSISMLYSIANAQAPPKTTTVTPSPAPAKVGSSTPGDAAACGCEGEPLPPVLAIVNGIKITRADISPPTEKRVAELQAEVIEARRREVDLQINSALLEAESARLKISTAKVLENEVINKIKEPTEAEAQAFYDQNKARIQSEFPAVKSYIISYLREQRQRDEAAGFAARLRSGAAVKILVTEATPPANPAERARLFATVNGRRITSAEVEDSLAPLIFSVQEQTYRLRMQDVDLKINDILLNAEAQKRNLATYAVLEAETDQKVPVITEAEAQDFYNKNKARMGGDFVQLKDQIIQYLKDEARRKLQSAFAERLRQAVPLHIFLKPPAPPTYEISVENQPAKGNANAAVTVIEFTDFECPTCAQAEPVLEKLLLEYGPRMRLVVRDFPLNKHAHAVKAAEAAEAARVQGKYWEYARLLYANQTALETTQLKEYASRLGLDRTRFDADLDGGTFSPAVLRDLRDGERMGVSGTPQIFVNGRQVSDPSYEGLKAAIEAALKNAPVR